MNLFPDCMAAFEEEAFSAVNADVVAEADIMAVDFTALFTFKDPQILAADNTGFFELRCDDSGVGGLAAAGCQEPLGLGNFFDVLRNRVLADKDQGTVGIFPVYPVNIFAGEDSAAGQSAAADTDALA